MDWKRSSEEWWAESVEGEASGVRTGGDSQVADASAISNASDAVSDTPADADPPTWHPDQPSRPFSLCEGRLLLVGVLD